MMRSLFAKQRTLQQELALLCEDDASRSAPFVGFVADLGEYLCAIETAFLPVAERALGRPLHALRALHARVRRALVLAVTPDIGRKTRWRRLLDLNDAFREYAAAQERLMAFMDSGEQGAPGAKA